MFSRVGGSTMRQVYHDQSRVLISKNWCWSHTYFWYLSWVIFVCRHGYYISLSPDHWYFSCSWWAFNIFAMEFLGSFFRSLITQRWTSSGPKVLSVYILIPWLTIEVQIQFPPISVIFHLPSCYNSEANRSLRKAINPSPFLQDFIFSLSDLLILLFLTHLLCALTK